MATVRMKKGDKFADIYDSPETIKQAQFEGYSLVEDTSKKKGKDENGDSGVGNSGTGEHSSEGSGNTETNQKKTKRQ